ncbi:MAG: hypothetical protein KHX71_09050, partial [Streptococcus mitis]|nr:hypothetical protein [Streptococcus mitis]
IIEPNRGKATVPLVSTLLERDKQVFEYDHLAINHLPFEFTFLGGMSREVKICFKSSFPFRMSLGEALKAKNSSRNARTARRLRQPQGIRMILARILKNCFIFIPLFVWI